MQHSLCQGLCFSAQSWVMLWIGLLRKGGFWWHKISEWDGLKIMKLRILISLQTQTKVHQIWACLMMSLSCCFPAWSFKVQDHKDEWRSHREVSCTVSLSSLATSSQAGCNRIRDQQMMLSGPEQGPISNWVQKRMMQWVFLKNVVLAKSLLNWGESKMKCYLLHYNLKTLQLV